MNEHRPTGRKLAILAVATVALLSALVLVRYLNSPRDPLTSAADEQAAAYADDILLGVLNGAADAPGGDRVGAVSDILHRQIGDEAENDPFPYAYLLLSESGSSFQVASFFYHNIRGFSQGFWGGPYWERVCRTYTVKATSVGVEALICSAEVPETPY